MILSVCLFVYLGDILECGICNTAVDALSTVLSKNGPKDRDNVSDTTCRLLPAKYFQTVTIYYYIGFVF